MSNSTLPPAATLLGLPITPSPLSSRKVLNSTVFVPALLGFIVLYHLLAPMYSTPKQLSWILTTCTSAVMTVASLPFVTDYVTNRGSVMDIRASPVFAYAVNRLFQAYLIADLMMGVAYYRAEVALLTGWIHHAVYVLIVEVAIKRSWAHIFCLCAAMELPTFILALGSIHPTFRSNTLFALSFFVTRIVLHIILCISYLIPANVAFATGGSYLPAGLLAFVFPLHAFWFSGCVKGFMKRRKLLMGSSSSREATVVRLDIQAGAPSTATTTPPRPSLQARRSLPGMVIPTLSLRSLRRKGKVVRAEVDEVDSGVQLFVR